MSDPTFTRHGTCAKCWRPIRYVLGFGWFHLDWTINHRAVRL